MNKLRDKQFYQKVGGKYHPLRSEYDTHGLSEGTYIVQVKPGSTNFSRMIENPARDEVEAVFAECRDEICKLIRDAQSCRPRAKMTKKQAACWEKGNKEVGGDFFRTLTIKSAADTVDKICEFIRSKVKK